VKLNPLGTSATTWPIIQSLNDRWWMLNSRWDENWQGKPKHSEKTCPSATFSRNPTYLDMGSIPDCRGGKPASNRLSYGAACLLKFQSSYVQKSVAADIWACQRVGVLDNQHFGTRCSVLSFFFDEWFTSTIGTCAFSSTTTYMVHAWWGATTFSPHLNQTFGEEWIASGACTITSPQSFGFLAVRSQKEFSVLSAGQWLRYYSNEYRKPVRRFVCPTKSWKLSSNAWDRHLYSICWRDHTNRRSFLYICWLGLFCSFKWVLYSFKACNVFFSLTPCILLVRRHSHRRGLLANSSSVWKSVVGCVYIQHSEAF
jgi:hypothetical protein